MKAVLTFDLDNADDNMSHKRCVKALDMAIVLWEIQSNFKKQCEHALEERVTDNRYDGLDLVMEKFEALMEEQSININELII